MEGRIKKKKIWFSDKEKIARSTCPLNRPNSLLANYFLKTKLLIKNVLKKIYQKKSTTNYRTWSLFGRFIPTPENPPS